MFSFLSRFFGRSQQLEEIKQSIFALTLAVTKVSEQQTTFERKFDMSQEKFDEQMRRLNERIELINTNAQKEATELSALKNVFETEIADLKRQLQAATGETVDTTALDDAIERLGQTANNVEKIVPAQATPTQPVNDTPEVPEVPTPTTPAEEYPSSTDE